MYPSSRKFTEGSFNSDGFLPHGNHVRVVYEEKRQKRAIVLTVFGLPTAILIGILVIFANHPEVLIKIQSLVARLAY